MPKAPTKDGAPRMLKPFQFHGLDCVDNGQGQGQGTCPFCGREGKFFVNLSSGLWDCKTCGASGNPVTFLRSMWEHSDRETNRADYAELAADRGLANPDTLIHWGVCKSHITGEWLIPGYNPEGKLAQLYRFAFDQETGKHKPYATPQELDKNATIRHQLHMPAKADLSKGQVYVCEGPWDGMALWESLRASKKVGENGDGKFVFTSVDGTSVGNEALVVAVPGASVFPDTWARLFTSKTVNLMFDSDHPRPHPTTGKTIESVGLAGTKRACKVLTGGAEGPPTAIRWLKWGADGYDPALPSGTDVRDVLNVGDITARVQALWDLLKRMDAVPPEWCDGGPNVGVVACDSYERLTNQFRKALKWNDGLDVALSVMLAVVASTMTPGSQLWATIMSPPSTGKTTLCEAIAAAQNHIRAMSTMRGFYSGFRGEGGDTDNAFITQLYDKTLVIKDGDTLLTAPNRDQILGEMRDIFDRSGRAHYRNGVHREYDNVNITIILAGTASLAQLDSAELGARFISCHIMREIDEQHEDDVAWKRSNMLIRNMTSGMKVASAQDKAGTSHEKSPEDPDMVLAKQLTGGYVNYIRHNVHGLLEQLEVDEVYTRRMMALGKFVAHMRARPSKSQDEKVEREFSTRLTEQFVKLGLCLAVVLGKKTFDDEVMRRVRWCAMDTSEGWMLNVCKFVNKAGTNGLEASSVALMTNMGEDKMVTRLRFMKTLGIVDFFVPKGQRGSQRWRFTDKMKKLYREVMGEVT